MKTYNVSIEEILFNSWEIEADNLEQAIEIAKEKYKTSEFILTADDIKDSATMQIENQDDMEEQTEWFEIY